MFIISMIEVDKDYVVLFVVFLDVEGVFMIYGR